MEQLLSQQHMFAVRLLFQLAQYGNVSFSLLSCHFFYKALPPMSPKKDIVKLMKKWRPLTGGGHTQFLVSFETIVSQTLHSLNSLVSGQATLVSVVWYLPTSTAYSTIYLKYLG